MASCVADESVGSVHFSSVVGKVDGFRISTDPIRDDIGQVACTKLNEIVHALHHSLLALEVGLLQVLETLDDAVDGVHIRACVANISPCLSSGCSSMTTS